jgi:hypothetical protein
MILQIFFIKVYLTIYYYQQKIIIFLPHSINRFHFHRSYLSERTSYLLHVRYDYVDLRLNAYCQLQLLVEFDKIDFCG